MYILNIQKFSLVSERWGLKKIGGKKVSEEDISSRFIFGEFKIVIKSEQ